MKISPLDRGASGGLTWDNPPRATRPLRSVKGFSTSPLDGGFSGERLVPFQIRLDLRYLQRIKPDHRRPLQELLGSAVATSTDSVPVRRARPKCRQNHLWKQLDYSNGLVFDSPGVSIRTSGRGILLIWSLPAGGPESTINWKVMFQ